MGGSTGVSDTWVVVTVAAVVAVADGVEDTCSGLTVPVFDGIKDLNSPGGAFSMSAKSSLIAMDQVVICAGINFR